MEARFSHDFSKVRVHTDEAAAESARSLDARAYAHGSQIAFAPGQYAPATREGDWLLAHELAHVVQGSGAPTTPASLHAKLQVGSDAAEEKADRAADQAVSTGRVDAALLTSSPGSFEVRRKPAPHPATASANATPAPPSSYEPPPEVMNGQIPLDAQVVSINTAPLFEALMQMEWPTPLKSDPSWPGWEEMVAFCDARNWSEGAKGATSGLGLLKTLSVADLGKGWLGSYFFSRIVVRGRVVSWSFESADGAGIVQQSAGGPTLSTGGTFQNTNTISGSVTGGATPGGGGGLTGSGTATGSQATTVGTSAGVSTAGTVGTQSAALEGVRFKVNMHFEVYVSQRLQAGTTTQLLTMGNEGAANMIKEVPSQVKHAVEVSAVVRFPKVRCSPMP